MKKNIYASLILACVFSLSINALEIINNTSQIIKISNWIPFLPFDETTLDLNSGEKKTSLFWDSFSATIKDNGDNKIYKFNDSSEALISFTETTNGKIKAYKEKNGRVEEILASETRVLKIKNNTSKKLIIQTFRESEYFCSRGPVALDTFSIEPGENDNYDWDENSVHHFEASIDGNSDKYVLSIDTMTSELLITFFETDGKIKLSIEQVSDYQNDHRIIEITVREGSPVCYACCDDYVCDGQRMEDGTYLKSCDN